MWVPAGFRQFAAVPMSPTTTQSARACAVQTHFCPSLFCVFFDKMAPGPCLAVPGPCFAVPRRSKRQKGDPLAPVRSKHTLSVSFLVFFCKNNQFVMQNGAQVLLCCAWAMLCCTRAQQTTERRSARTCAVQTHFCPSHLWVFCDRIASRRCFAAQRLCFAAPRPCFVAPRPYFLAPRPCFAAPRPCFDAPRSWFCLARCRPGPALLRSAPALLRQGPVFAFSDPLYYMTMITATVQQINR